MSYQTTVRVTNVRSKGKFGGAIFSGYEIDVNGNIINAYKPLVVKLNKKDVYPGEVWSIEGKIKSYKGVSNGYHYEEDQLEASSAYRKSVCGDNFIDYVSSHEAFKGIGRNKAQKLWNTFQEELYVHLDNHDIDKLKPVLTPETASILVDEWSRHGFSISLEWLDQMNIPSSMGRKVIQHYANETEQKIKEDPYRILAFGGDWRAIDKIALTKLDISVDDSRRLSAAIEDSLLKAFAKGRKKSTALTANDLRQYLTRLLGDKQTYLPSSDTAALVKRALSIESIAYVKHNDIYQHAGAFQMESSVALTFSSMLNANIPNVLSADAVSDTIDKYEEVFSVQLTTEQRQAVFSSAYSPFLVISGGAGTGKTTVLNCIYKVLERRKTTIIQMALAGRAAKRMHEATGLEAVTIASFLNKYEGNDTFPDNACVVIDEASMVDVIHAWRILSVIKDDTQIIMVGDPKQLPPIGAGLIFHILAEHSAIERTQLKVVRRNAEGSILPTIAKKIRNHIFPSFPKYNGVQNNVSFLECNPNDIDQTVLNVFTELSIDCDDVKVVCSVKNGKQGTKIINQICQETFRKYDNDVIQFNDEYDCIENLKFKLNDTIMFTRNDYTRGLMNGSLGKIVELLDPEDKMGICTVDFEGLRIDLTVEDLDDIELAYAVTCHKAQGSQFKRVIVPVLKNNNLDQSLVYTAVTRGVEQVVLVGRIHDAKSAVEGPAAHIKRTTGFATLLNNAINNFSTSNKL